MKADVFRARARNYPSALEASLFKDDVPVAVYDGLIASVRKGVTPFFVIMICGGARSGSTICTPTTLMFRWSRKSKRTSPLTKRSIK